jgi:DNA-binding MltR family transcriptional regulator
MAKRVTSASLERLKASVEVLTQRSHSGAVIALTALMDVWLERVLKKALVPMPNRMHKRLFDAYRPLNTFASKIIVAYGVGAIPLETYEELEKIRAIRNIFAHGTVLLTFENATLAALVVTLKGQGETPIDRFIASINGVREEMQKYLAKDTATVADRGAAV